MINWTAVAGEARTPEQNAIASRASVLEVKTAELQKECDNLGLVIRKTPLPTLVRDLAELEKKKETIETEVATLRKQLDFLETHGRDSSALFPSKKLPTMPPTVTCVSPSGRNSPGASSASF